MDLDYYDTEWFGLEMYRDHPVVFEIALKYCISNCFVGYEDCFILYSKAKVACYSRFFLTSYFCIPIPMMKRTYYFGVHSRQSCRSS